MNRKRHCWTAAEDRRLTDRYPDCNTADLAAELNLAVTQVYHRANTLKLRKSQEFLRAQLYLAGQAIAQIGTHTQFQPGRKTWNKGQHFVAGGRSAETRFKPKQRPPNYKPVGSERVSKNGYRQRKLTDTGYPPHDWVCLHHIIWRSAGRDIPNGFALCFIDGNKQNIHLENLHLVSRQDLMRRNSYQNHGPEIATVIQLRGAITRQINQLERTRNEHP